MHTILGTQGWDRLLCQVNRGGIEILLLIIFSVIALLV